MRRAGIEAVIESESLAVVGLVEVISHLPRIYRQYRKLLSAARDSRPQLAILTDSPDFHLRLATQLKKLGIPVIYLVAPQVWAWRKGRIPGMRRLPVPNRLKKRSALRCASRIGWRREWLRSRKA